MSAKIKPPRWVVGCAMIGMAVQLTTAADFFEDFTTPPSPDRWLTHGDAALFQWNPAGHLDVTWDSSRTNSFFFHRLGTILGKDDDFTLAFELRLKSVMSGFREDKPYTFELALGLINVADATRTNFFRGAGTGNVKNLVEFDYFPDNGLGATIWPAVWSTNASLSYRDGNDYTLIELPLNTVLQIQMQYTATNRTLRTTITADGQSFGPVNPLILSPFFTDFRVDAFAICSYSDTGTDGSLLATGEIDNVRLTLPPPPLEELSLVQGSGAWKLQFPSRTKWFYRAQSTTDFTGWSSADIAYEGTGGLLGIPVEATRDLRFWRIQATRP
jgi:hypothetical protein